MNVSVAARASLPLLFAPPVRRKLVSLLTAACLGVAGAGTALANPSGPQVVNGQVTFSQQGNVFSIANSPNAIINWTSFSIAPGEVTRFIQQSSSSAVLNRITGQDPSRIMGALQSNGRVYLINPNGILFGANAQVDVSGLVASTLAIANADFLAGKNKFAAGTIAGEVSNLGTIKTPTGGQVWLIGPNVGNSGIITSPQGEVVLAAGQSVQMADATNPGMHVLVSAPSDQAINLGQVIAQSGKIGIYGALVNQRGTLNADSAVAGENGKIVLKASRTTLLEAGSVTTAVGAGTGGEIQVLGEQVGLNGNARVDASGQNGGGTVLIGGDYQGKNAAVMNAQQVFVGKDTQISANAIARGNGGKVIVWSDQATRVHGAITARGGSESGNGGFIETSGHFLDVAGIRVDAGAANGQQGKWLLDPYDIQVSSGEYPLTSLSDVASFNSNGGSQDGDITYIGASQISTANADVTLQALHDINIQAPIIVNTAGVGLTMQAGNDINVNASISTTGGALVLSANDNGGGTASGVGRVNLMSGAALNTNGGSLTVRDSATPQPPTLPSLATCIATPNAQGCSAVLPSLQTCAANPNLAGCEAVLPRPDFCGTHPMDPLCMVFMPPTDDEKAKPVEQTVQTTVSLLDRLIGNPTNTPAESSKPQDTRKVPGSSENSGAKNEKPATKMYCN